MADTATLGAAAPKTHQAPSTDIHQLQNTISDIGGLAQEGLGSIGAVAYLTMHWLETRETRQIDTKILRSIIGLIRDHADNYSHIIEAEAAAVGCSRLA